MSERRTRRQAAMEAAAVAASTDETPIKTDEAETTMNGNGQAVASSDPKVEDASEESQENIFLFWPNIIGMCLSHPREATFLYRKAPFTSSRS